MFMSAVGDIRVAGRDLGIVPTLDLTDSSRQQASLFGRVPVLTNLCSSRGLQKGQVSRHVVLLNQGRRKPHENGDRGHWADCRDVGTCDRNGFRRLQLARPTGCDDRGLG